MAPLIASASLLTILAFVCIALILPVSIKNTVRDWRKPGPSEPAPNWHFSAAAWRAWGRIAVPATWLLVVVLPFGVMEIVGVDDGAGYDAAAAVASLPVIAAFFFMCTCAFASWPQWMIPHRFRGPGYFAETEPDPDDVDRAARRRQDPGDSEHLDHQ